MGGYSNVWSDVDMTDVPLEKMRDVVESLLTHLGVKLQELPDYHGNSYRVVPDTLDNSTARFYRYLDTPNQNLPDWKKKFTQEK